MKRNWFISLAPLALAASTLVAAPALAAPPPAQVLPGEVVTVTGTPNLWVADSQGVLHFAGDPRALAGHAVDWSAQLDLAQEQVGTLPVGDPWLTASLVKIGDEIFLPQWGAGAAAPTLRHIQSPSDLADLGINAGNYGQFVLDQQAWEQRYNLSLDRVEFDGDFALTPPVATADTSSDTTTHGDGGATSDSAAPASDSAAPVENAS